MAWVIGVSEYNPRTWRKSIVKQFFESTKKLWTGAYPAQKQATSSQSAYVVERRTAAPSVAKKSKALDKTETPSWRRCEKRIQNQQKSSKEGPET